MKKKDEELVVPPIKPEFKIIGLYGEIDEDSAAKVSWDMLSLWDTIRQENWEREYGAEEEAADIEDPSFEMLISSRGGSVWEMFAIYDIIRTMRGQCEVVTKGMGKVMSAAVLLLAAGAKGKRMIGRNCRVMIHSVSGDHAGSMAELKIELKEAEKMQDMYIDALTEESDMTKVQIKKLIQKNTDVYFSAEEAVKYGIADIII